MGHASTLPASTSLPNGRAWCPATGDAAGRGQPEDEPLGPADGPCQGACLVFDGTDDRHRPDAGGGEKITVAAAQKVGALASLPRVVVSHVGAQIGDGERPGAREPWVPDNAAPIRVGAVCHPERLPKEAWTWNAFSSGCRDVGAEEQHAPGGSAVFAGDVLGGQEQAGHQGVAVRINRPHLLQLINQKEQWRMPFRAPEFGERGGHALFQHLQLPDGPGPFRVAVCPVAPNTDRRLDETEGASESEAD